MWIFFWKHQVRPHVSAGLIIGKFGYFTLAIDGDHACYDSDFYMYEIMGS
jgi:hypothetical protein